MLVPAAPAPKEHERTLPERPRFALAPFSLSWEIRSNRYSSCESMRVSDCDVADVNSGSLPFDARRFPDTSFRDLPNAPSGVQTRSSHPTSRCRTVTGSLNYYETASDSLECAGCCSRPGFVAGMPRTQQWQQGIDSTAGERNEAGPAGSNAGKH
jgi:hypothetical protein